MAQTTSGVMCVCSPTVKSTTGVRLAPGGEDGAWRKGFVYWILARVYGLYRSGVLLGVSNIFGIDTWCGVKRYLVGKRRG